MSKTTNFKFTKSCEINNIEFQKGDIIGPDQGIGYFPSVMNTTNESPTISIQKTTSVAIEKVDAAKKEEKTPPKAEKTLEKMNKQELFAIIEELKIEGLTMENTQKEMVAAIKAKKEEKTPPDNVD